MGGEGEVNILKSPPKAKLVKTHYLLFNQHWYFIITLKV